MSGAQRSKRRRELWEADPSCYWCGVATLMDVGEAEALFATIDHLISRNHPERRYAKGRTVLCCRGCNHERSLAEQHGRVFIPRLVERLADALKHCATRANRARRHHVNSYATPMRVICTIGEALAFARANGGKVNGTKQKARLFADGPGGRTELGEIVDVGSEDDLRRRVMDAHWDSRLDAASCQAIVEFEPAEDDDEHVDSALPV